MLLRRCITFLIFAAVGLLRAATLPSDGSAPSSVEPHSEKPYVLAPSERISKHMPRCAKVFREGSEDWAARTERAPVA